MLNIFNQLMVGLLILFTLPIQAFTYIFTLLYRSIKSFLSRDRHVFFLENQNEVEGSQLLTSSVIPINKYFKKHILVLGQDKPITKEIAGTLAYEEYETSLVFSLSDLTENLLDRAESIIVVGPMTGMNIRKTITTLNKKLRKRNSSLIAVTHSFASLFEKQVLYKMGCHLVIEWPGESSDIRRLVKGISLSNPIDTEADDSDVSLKSALVNRMMIDNRFKRSNLLYSVYNGIVIANTRLLSSSSEERLKKRVEKIPGVKGVILSS